MNNIALIPARGGSKGIPNKNLKLIKGYPLIYWSIKQALEADNISDVFVSTDCPEIAKVARQCGAKIPFLRPAHLANDLASTESVMLHFCCWLKESNIKCDNIVLLQPTSPMRLEGTISRAIDQFVNSNADSLVAVAETHNFFWSKKANSELNASYDYYKRPRRQDINPEDVKYVETGSIYISKVNGLEKSKNRLFGKIDLFIMQEIEAHEIDSLNDLIVCEALMKNIEK
jgi:CMP-N,N'-diacetyllegionaminic acid synthase